MVMYHHQNVAKGKYLEITVTISLWMKFWFKSRLNLGNAS
jgi:hypothetical protein